MRYYKLLLQLFLFLGMGFVPQVGALHWKVQGLSAELKKNVTAYLDSLNLHQAPIGDAAVEKQIEQSIRQTLRAKGYYEPTINFAYKSVQRGVASFLTIQVNPGRPVSIVSVNVELQGDIQEDVDYQQLLKKGLPQIGEVLDHGTFDQLIVALSELAVRKGYFDAEIVQQQLIVTPSRYTAAWQITFKGGRRYHFGSLFIQGAKIDLTPLRNLLPFKEGEPYHINALMELNQRLVATQWFRIVSITPQFEAVDRYYHLPLLINVEHHSRNSVEVGLRCSMPLDTGLHLQWKKPCINYRGHRLESQLNLSQIEQQVKVVYTIPSFRNPLAQYYTIELGWERQDKENLASSIADINVVRHWRFSNNWQFALSARGSYGRFMQTGKYCKTRSLSPGIELSRVRRQGDLIPYWGDKQHYTIALSHKIWHSDVNFLLFKLHHLWVRTPKSHHRWVGRFDMGWIISDQLLLVPTPLRFFAGGQGSVRGYPAQSLSPKDTKGVLTGASKMVSASFEYQYLLTPLNCWVSIFCDGGIAEHQFSYAAFKKAVGIGFCWSSPLGPIKVDVACPLFDSQHQRLHLYLTLGAEL